MPECNTNLTVYRSEIFRFRIIWINIWPSSPFLSSRALLFLPIRFVPGAPGTLGPIYGGETRGSDLFLGIPFLTHIARRLDSLCLIHGVQQYSYDGRNK